MRYRRPLHPLSIKNDLLCGSDTILLTPSVVASRRIRSRPSVEFPGSDHAHEIRIAAPNQKPMRIRR